MKEAEKYIETKDAILALVGDKDVFSARALSKELTIEQKYDAKIKRLKEKKDMFIREIEADRSGHTKAIEEKINVLAETLKITERKIAILENTDKIEEKTKEVELDKTLFESTGSSQLIWLDDLVKEKYLHIILCIAENNRPKNRYSLVAYGRCAFYPIMDNIRGSYASCHVNMSDHKANPMFDEISYNAPTIEEVQEYAKKNRSSIMLAFLAKYRQTKEEYEDTIRKYTLKDFEALRTIREVSDVEAPIAFKMTKYDKTNTVRIYKNVYYSSLIGKADAPTWEYIKVDGVVYVCLCRTELMTIKQTGNTTFGDWWNTSLENDTPNEKTLFNKENYERHIEETTAWLKKRTGEEYKKINWNPPQIEWVHPELLPSFSIWVKIMPEKSKEVSTEETQKIIAKRQAERLKITKGVSRKKRIDRANRVK